MNNERVNIYIDGNNLYRAASECGFVIDYKKFIGWMRQKYKPENVYLFIGFMPKNISFYNRLLRLGYKLVYKQTVSVGGVVKGNCDAELVLKVVSDFYTRQYDECIIVSGDGDFGCLIEFLKNQKTILCVIVPDENKCSILIRNKFVKVVFLNDLYHKFSTLRQ